ncbi:type I pantothenate kinase [Corynebacterium aquatimens]|uniref:Pantothenate kinase n=1 Tax=Corynebacterium aquatimens TaxID=1190508 RepID=A0A931E0N6_9CORY|nr:type I pantothenate kinase [Corynebacterium aquatimens]MBG6121211.1 type I pantothenate kinase [Corynebacterium aquatimens]
MPRASEPSPYLDFDRRQWRERRATMPQVLTETDLEDLRGIGEIIDLTEVAEIYLPLSRLIHMRVKARQKLITATETFLWESLGEGLSREPVKGNPKHVPFIIGIAGSVAVGKSTTARVLQVLLQRWKSHPRVDLVTTDGFLKPTAELKEKGLLERKGFPESYNRRDLMRFVSDVKAGRESVKAPVYSHDAYDVIPGEFQEINQPDILIVEGLNVLQTGPTLMVSDLFDFSVYVDAHPRDIEQWYIDRFIKLKNTNFRKPGAHFARYAELDDEQAAIKAREIWQTINLPNLVENIRPTRIRASLVLHKDSDHSIQRVRMRKI